MFDHVPYFIYGFDPEYFAHISDNGQSPAGRLWLLSELQCPLADTKSCCLVAERQPWEQLARWCYVLVPMAGVESVWYFRWSWEPVKVPRLGIRTSRSVPLRWFAICQTPPPALPATRRFRPGPTGRHRQVTAAAVGAGRWNPKYGARRRQRRSRARCHRSWCRRSSVSTSSLITWNSRMSLTRCSS